MESLSILAVVQRIFEPMLAARNRRAYGINRDLKRRAVVEVALFMKVRLASRHPFPLRVARATLQKMRADSRRNERVADDSFSVPSALRATGPHEHTAQYIMSFYDIIPRVSQEWHLHMIHVHGVVSPVSLVAYGLVGPVGAVEIRDHVIPFPF